MIEQHSDIAMTILKEATEIGVKLDQLREINTEVHFVADELHGLSWKQEMSEKYIEIAAQTKTEVSELVLIAADTRRQIRDIATEAASVRELILEVQLMRGEIQAARFGGQPMNEIQGSGGTVMSELQQIRAEIVGARFDTQQVGVHVVAAESKLSFMDFALESLFLYI